MALPALRTPPDLGLKTSDYVCAFYWGHRGGDAVMLPFLEAGLMAGEKCLCVLHGPTPP